MEGLKIGGLWSGPLLKMGGFQNWPTREKRGFGAKNNKETYTFLKEWSFPAAQVEKVESLGAAKAKHGGFSEAHTRTVPIWEYPAGRRSRETKNIHVNRQISQLSESKSLLRDKIIPKSNIVRSGDNLAVILVRMCGPTFHNPPHSYTWVLKIGTHSYTGLAFKITTYTYILVRYTK